MHSPMVSAAGLMARIQRRTGHHGCEVTGCGSWVALVAQGQGEQQGSNIEHLVSDRTRT